MIVHLFAVRDTKADAFMSPFTMRTTAEAIRAFTQSVNDPSTQLYKTPEDFILYELADYNEATGEISPIQPIKNVISAFSVKEQHDAQR
jgi:hypothetical protein